MMFAGFTSSFSRYLFAADADLHNTSTKDSGKTSKVTAAAAAYDPAKLDKFIDTLQRYDNHFSRYLKMLLDALNYLAATETVVFLGLCARLSTASEGEPGSVENLMAAG